MSNPVNTNVCTVRIARWRDDGWALRMIREEVFVHEQHVPIELEWDTLDSSCIHMLALDSEGNPVGTARLLPEADYRSHGSAEGVATERRGERSSPELAGRSEKAASAAGSFECTGIRRGDFYTKFGFQIVGDEFLDAGIPHRRMTSTIR